MKLTFIALIAILFQVNAENVFGQKTKVSFELNNVKLERVFEKIEKLTDFKFTYKDNDVDYKKVISIKAKNEKISSVLERIFKGTNTTFELLNKQIILKRRTVKQVNQDKIRVEGIVTDNLNMPLPGVTILVKGVQKGAITDFDGKYSILVNKDATLIYSYVGYKTKEIVVDGRENINVQLEEDIAELEEVVITGIVTRKKESFTGTTKTVKREELQKIGNLNILESVKTLDPSFIISDNSSLGSDPNALPNIEIRGQSGINTNDLRDEFGANPNQPLFILDGFETSLRTIVDLDMNRVASITLLKDAASTALYGSKSANGVIVIETRKPRPGELRVNYNSDFRIDMPDLSDYNLMNAVQKLEYERLSGLWTNSNSALQQNILDVQYNAILAETLRGVDTYWLNKPLQVGTTLGHSVNVDGGTNELRYGIGLNYRDLQGVMIGSNRETWGASFVLNYRVGKINITNNLRINGTDSNQSPYGSFSNFSRANPYFRPVDEFGQITPFLDIDGYHGTSIINPLYAATLNSYNNANDFDITNNLRAIWSLNSKFRLQANLQISSSKNETQKFVSPRDPSFVNDSFLTSGSYDQGNTKSNGYSANLMASYTTVFNDIHSITANIRGEIENRNNERVSFDALGFPEGTNGNPAFSFGFDPNSRPGTAIRKTRSVGALASVNYTIDKTYFFDGTTRIDGASLFGSNNKYQTFWSIGAGVNFHNLLNVDEDVLSLLRLRGNIGENGNQGFGNISSNSIYTYYSTLNVFGQGTQLSSLANPNLKWQNTLNTSFGIDMSGLKNRFNTTFNIFNKTSKPLIANVTLPSSTGVTSYATNIGQQSITGVETIIGFTPIDDRDNEISWSFRVTMASILSNEYSGFDNILDGLNEAQQTSNSLSRFRDGGSPDDLWAVESLGIDPGTGREVFLTLDGQPTFDYNANDEKVIASARPDVQGVISSNFRWKKIGLGVNFRYTYGGHQFNTSLFNKVEGITEANRIDNQDVRALTDRWTNPGDIAQFKGISNFESTPVSSRFIQENNTISAESINLSYTFSEQTNWMKKIGLTRLAFTARTNNLFRVSTIKLERGIDFPFSRSVNFSLNASF